MLGKVAGGSIDPDYPEFNGYTLTKLELLVLGGYFVIIVMGEDEYFVLGDNRNNSSDSRASDVGLIHRKDLIGRAWIRVWPLSQIGVIHHE